MSKLLGINNTTVQETISNDKEMHYSVKETQTPRSMFLKEPFKSNLGLQ